VFPRLARTSRVTLPDFQFAKTHVLVFGSNVSRVLVAVAGGSISVSFSMGMESIF
jgi:hypothetical protein